MSSAARPSFNASVHGARGLFAMMVFVYHIVHSGLPGLLGADSLLDKYLLHSFQFGVELFFGISGFVILGALRRAASIRSFVWDRLTRIYPLLWLTLIAITLAAVIGGLWQPPIGDWLLNFLAPPPFFPLPMVNPAAWSLGYEISFYMLCAFCWWLHARGGNAWLVVAVGVGAVLLVLFPRAALMPFGLLIAAGLLSRFTLLRRLSAMPVLPLLVFLLCWRVVDLACGSNIMHFSPVHLALTDWLALLPIAVVGALSGGLALFGIAEGRGLLGRLLRLPVLQWLGTISYSFYLWHPVVLAPVKRALYATGLAEAAGPGAQLLFAVIALPPALLIAHFSQAWIEVRLTRRLRRLGPREGGGRAPLTAVHPAP